MKTRHFIKRFLFILMGFISAAYNYAQDIEEGKTYYILHSSGNILIRNTEDIALIHEPSFSVYGRFNFVSDGNGYYAIKSQNANKYLSLKGDWNTSFETSADTDNSLFAIEKVNNTLSRLKCKANNKYLGVDTTTPGSWVFADKSGTESRHYWYITTNPKEEIPIDTISYTLNPEAERQYFDGWGVSLCWWANMCGKWDDAKIDEIVDWLVSPEGLNYRIFRYNIGGGDDPLNRNCTPHHMGSGKGLRAEMEGFKDSSDGPYIWTRDEAQRKIMLKIKEKRPDAIFEAFSNSCPYYMTYSGCCAGHADPWKDNLRPEYYEEFAHYLVDVCKHYKEEYGIEFKTLEPFNEPMTGYWGANGGQEGCHFDVNSQIEFIKVLSPILKESGLNTIISASDETDVAQGVRDFVAYKEAGVLDMVGQWNVHTYSADQNSRSQISALCEDYGMPLWMSEVGAGGSGIGGNLSMAQKLINDIRYIMPEAWIDWQYMEEGNDQWCLINGDFASQSYQKIKNYYIRQHFSKYIKEGYTFLTTTNDKTLAARNSYGDTLVMVVINPESMPAYHKADMSMYDIDIANIECLVTDETVNLAGFDEFALNDDILSFRMQPFSIMTFVATVSPKEYDAVTPQEGDSYVIIPRNAANLALTGNGNISIEENRLDASQIWTLENKSSGFSLKNGNGKYLTATSSYYLSESANSASGQAFSFIPTDNLFYKIMSLSTGKSLDLEGEHYGAGTRVGIWEYGTSPTACHRQWQLIRVPDEDSETGIGCIKDMYGETANMFDASADNGILKLMPCSEGEGRFQIFNSGGVMMYNRVSSGEINIPLKSGYYIIRYIKNGKSYSKTVLVK